MRYVRFIILSVICSIVLLGCAGKTEQAKAKYVFYFIGDGMGVNQVIGTEMYLAELEGRIGTKSLSFTSFPVRNYMTTYSATNAVTCSAAAGTALATGTKTQNGRIGMRQDSSVLYSIACKAKQAGKAVGVTTSVAINHATPAVFTRINRIGRCITRSEQMPLKPDSTFTGERDGNKSFLLMILRR